MNDLSNGAHGTASVRRRSLVLASLAALGSGACSTLGGPRTIEISQARLIEAMSRQFPLQIGLFAPLELIAMSPRLRLLPEENRLGTEIDLQIARGLGARSWSGTVGFSYALRYEPSDRSLRLDRLQIERLDLGSHVGLPNLRGGRVATALAEELLNDLVVYQLKPEDVHRLDAHGLAPGDIRVTAGGLAITLLPKR